MEKERELKDIPLKVEELVNEQVEVLLTKSETYLDALKTIRPHRLSYHHGDLGKAIDDLIVREIKHRALIQPIK